jgi:hypothetical protein
MLSNFDFNCCKWASNNFSNYAPSNGQSNWNYASNYATWASNNFSNLSNCCATTMWASNNFSNYAPSNYMSNWNYASNTSWWTSNALSNFDSNCCAWVSNLAVWTSNALSNYCACGSNSSGSSSNDTCAQFFSDVVTLTTLGSTTISHNLDLANPDAFIITVFDKDTGAILSPAITATTANTISLKGTALSLNAVVNIQRNVSCGATGSKCSYENLTAFNTTQTLSDGTIATVSGGTGGNSKTWQGITGYNLGDLEDNERMNFAFSKSVKRLRVTIDAVERISGVYEQIKLFINGAPYAVQPSEMITPLTAGGKMQLIDGGFTLDPVSVADDASAQVIIEPPGGITSFGAQDIRVSGAPNGAVVKVEALICK